jgi:hypothetical protein
MSSEPKTVKIPAELHAKLASRAEETGKSVDELASAAVRDFLTMGAEPGAERRQVAVSKKDQKVIEERLKSLGYM